MNILHLTHTDIRSDSRILKEMKCISTQLSNYHVYGIGVRYDEEKHKTEDEHPFSIKIINLKSRHWKFLPDFIRHTLSLIELSLKIFFYALRLKPKIIHCHDTTVLPLGVLVKIFTRAKLIYDAHELESNRNGLSPLLRKATALVEKILWRCVDYLIVVSPSIKMWYNQTFGKKATAVIMNSPYLDLENSINYKKTYLREKFKIPNEATIYIYIGILGRGRGIDLILDVFKRKDITAHVVFLGYGEFEEDIKNITKQYNNIHVHNAVPHSEVVPIAKSADVGFCLVENVSLSDYYCLPNKLFEYAFAGLPILASKFPDIVQIVEKYNLGECTDLDADSLYKIISCKLAIKEASEKNNISLYPLSWSAQEEKLMEVYKNLGAEVD